MRPKFSLASNRFLTWFEHNRYKRVGVVIIRVDTFEIYNKGQSNFDFQKSSFQKGWRQKKYTRKLMYKSKPNFVTKVASPSHYVFSLSLSLFLSPAISVIITGKQRIKH